MGTGQGPFGTRVISRGIGLSFQGPRGAYSHVGVEYYTLVSVLVNDCLRAHRPGGNYGQLCSHFFYRPVDPNGPGFRTWIRDEVPRGEAVYGPAPFRVQAKLSGTVSIYATDGYYIIN